MEIILPNREEWLEARNRGLGASDSGTIIGVNPWKSNLDLYKEKVGISKPDDISKNPHVILGNKEEPLVRELFALENPQYEVVFESAYKMIFHSSYSFLFCTLDGELIERETGRKGILEIKTTEIRRNEQWKEWEDRIPQTYYAQVCHQLICTGWDFAILKARIRYYKNDELRIAERQYTITREEAKKDMEFILEAEKSFWDSVQKKSPPALVLPSI